MSNSDNINPFKACVVLTCPICHTTTCVHPSSDGTFRFSEHYGTINGLLTRCNSVLSLVEYNILLVHKESNDQ